MAEKRAEKRAERFDISTVGQETRFQPGNQFAKGNGRPPHKTLLTDELNKLLAQIDDKKTQRLVAKTIAEAMIKYAKKGSVSHFEAIIKRTEGLPPQAVTFDGDPLVQIAIEVKNVSEARARALELTQRFRNRAAKSDGVAGVSEGS